MKKNNSVYNFKKWIKSMSSIKSLIFLICFVMNFLYLSNADAATLTAKSCSRAHVQSAINSAKMGDIVIIPKGNCTWASPVIIHKAITLKGNGSYSENANHEDTGTWPLTITLSGNNGIELSGTSGQNIRITGIHFSGSTGCGTSGNGAILIPTSNATGNWRIDNSKFTVSCNAVAVLTSGLGGLIDHIYAYDSGCGDGGAILVMDQRNDYTGGWAFTQPINWGSSNFVFVEDSTFWKNGCTGSAGAPAVSDAQANGKYVFRRNYVRDAMAVWHGTESGAPQRGGYAFEIYNNEFYWSMPSDRYHTAIFHRGGTALIYDNQVTNYQFLWKTWVRRATRSFGEFGRCDGTQVHDGNRGGSYPRGYPCLDQVGRGRASGVSLNKVQPQEGSKSYIWNNIGINTDAFFHVNPDYVVSGRDYEFCNDSSCAPVGYTPYPYPHPLVTDNPAPNPPQNLRIIQ